MGYGSYSVEDRLTRASVSGFYSEPVEKVFSSHLQNSMSPMNLGIRESRDSDEHPTSLAVMFALDVTGSMMDVPSLLVKDGLPTMISEISNNGVKDIQLMFLGVGDHECDRAPLQVGQFETSDELIDKWLTGVYLEKGGGGNDGESYQLAWYTAANHTSIDCFEKRGQKGFLFTVGDEKVLPSISADTLKRLFGDGQYSTLSTKDILKKAQEMYHVYHIHTTETGAGKRYGVQDHWRELLQDNLIVVQSHKDIPAVVSKIISSNLNTSMNKPGVTRIETGTEDIQML